jgi:acid phosphatase
MHFRTLILLITLFIVAINSYAQEKLIFALDLIRHGDRTPIWTIPNSPHTWPEGMQQLTAQGMQQELQLGKKFHKIYIDHYHLLPNQYQNDAIYVFSTNYDRTLMSAEAVLLGLYPLGSGPLLSTKQPALPGAFRPIPIHTQPLDKNDSFVTDVHANYQQLEKKYVDSRPDWAQKTAELQNKFPIWSKATGLPITNIRQLIALADTFKIYQIHHLPLAVKLSDEDVKQVMAAGTWAFTTEFQTKEIANLIGTPLLAKVADYIQKATQLNNPLKYVLLSAHDTTIMSLMTTLHAPLNSPPPYASDVNFSLFKDGSEYTVKISYNGQPVVLPGCNATGCSLMQFAKLTS